MRWQDLSTEKQEQVAYSWAKKLTKNPEKLDTEFLSIGVGYKLSKGRLRRLICLKFTVQKKRKLPPPGSSLIPDKIAARVRVKGKYYTVEIPTDVEDLEAGGPQFGLRVVDPAGAWPDHFGVATALVRDETQSNYILSCHHVLAASQMTKDLRGVNYANVWGDAFNLADVMASRIRKAQFPHTAIRWAIDASLAKLHVAHEQAVVSSFRNRTAADYLRGALKARRNFSNGTKVTIRTARGHIQGTISNHLKYGGTFLYDAAGTASYIEIKEAYEVRTDGAPTIAGDSGSPVVIDYVLVGMHFWGKPLQNLSYFIPSWVFLDRTTFGRELNFIG